MAWGAQEDCRRLSLTKRYYILVVVDTTKALTTVSANGALKRRFVSGSAVYKKWMDGLTLVGTRGKARANHSFYFSLFRWKVSSSVSWNLFPSLYLLHGSGKKKLGQTVESWEEGEKSSVLLGWDCHSSLVTPVASSFVRCWRTTRGVFAHPPVEAIGRAAVWPAPGWGHPPVASFFALNSCAPLFSTWGLSLLLLPFTC